MINKVNKKLIFIGIINFLKSYCNYIILPVLAIHLNRYLSITQTSVIVALPTVASTFFSFVTFKIEKRAGTFRLLIFSTFITIISYISYTIVMDFYILIFFSLLLGFGRVLWEPIIKSMFTLIDDDIDLSFRIRYISICAAGILGPVSSLIINTFFTTKINFYFSYLIMVVIIMVLSLNREKISKLNSKNINTKQEQNKYIKYNHPNILLVYYICGGTLVFLVFSQFESIFSLFLKNYFLKPEKVFSYLLILNSLFGAVFQSLIMRKTKKTKNIKNICIGNALFAVAFLMFAYSNFSITYLALAVIIYSMGEVLVIPGVEIAIATICNQQNSTLYFGIAELRMLGFTLGPIFAGVLLDKYTPAIVCICNSIIICISCLLFVQKINLSKDF